MTFTYLNDNCCYLDSYPDIKASLEALISQIERREDFDDNWHEVIASMKSNGNDVSPSDIEQECVDSIERSLMKLCKQVLTELCDKPRFAHQG
jgi:hypothetical protein